MRTLFNLATNGVDISDDDSPDVWWSCDNTNHEDFDFLNATYQMDNSIHPDKMTETELRMFVLFVHWMNTL